MGTTAKCFPGFGKFNNSFMLYTGGSVVRDNDENNAGRAEIVFTGG